MGTIAVVGATGAVGKELLSLLEERNFPVDSLRCFASLRSKGLSLFFRKEAIPIEILNENALTGIDLTFFCAGAKISREWIPHWRGQVIDLSSAFRQEPTVPLIIPEINAHLLIDKPAQLIASPNCAATVLLMPLYKLHRQFHVKRIVCSTYQAASGGGINLVNELKKETKALIENHPYTPHLPFPYAFNLFPHNSPLHPSGYVDEEIKIKDEVRKILEDPKIQISATAVRVPVLRAHALSANVEFQKPFSLEEVYSFLENTPGLKIFEDRKTNRFATPLDASHIDDVLAGRFRIDPSQPNTLEFWAVGDQLRKGAALNAVQIAEALKTSVQKTLS